MRLTFLTTLLASFSAPALAHGAHVASLRGHSHMLEIVSVVAFGFLVTAFIKKRA